MGLEDLRSNHPELNPTEPTQPESPIQSNADAEGQSASVDTSFPSKDTASEEKVSSSFGADPVRSSEPEPQEPKNGKKLFIIILLSLLIVCLSGYLIWFIFIHHGLDREDPITTPKPTPIVTPVVSASPTPTASSTPTPVPTVKPTVAPTSTPVPTATPNPAHSSTANAIGTITVNDAGLRIRSLASTSGTVLGTVSAGKSYTVYETTSAEGYAWYRIGNNQWIAGIEGNWTTYAPYGSNTESSIGSITVNDTGLRIRSYASTSASILGTCRNGTTYTVYETAYNEGYTWYRIGNGQWIAGVEGSWTSYVPNGTVSAYGSVYIMVSGLNIRSYASTSGSKVGTAKEGATYSVYETAYNDGYTWYRIGNNQWIAGIEGSWTNFWTN